MKLSTRRRGVPFYADFYAANLLWNKDSTESTIIYEEVCKHTRKILLGEVSLCIISELRHFPVFTGKNLLSYIAIPSSQAALIGAAAEMRSWGWIFATVRKNGGYDGFFRATENMFLETWSNEYYGGKKWAEIARRGLALYESRLGNLNQMSVAIDMLIDSCHNTGNTLDKIHPSIKTFLSRKTFEESADWLIKLAQPAVRKMNSYK